MSLVVEVTLSAEASMHRIFLHYSENTSVEIAINIIDRILNRIESLSAFDKRGRIVEELSKN